MELLMYRLSAAIPKRLGAILNFHKRYLLQTKLSLALHLEHALSSLLLTLALSQISHLLEYLLLDNVQVPESNSSEDIILDQSEYAQIYLYTSKIRQFDNFQHVQLSRYIVAGPQPTCSLS